MTSTISGSSQITFVLSQHAMMDRNVWPTQSGVDYYRHWKLLSVSDTLITHALELILRDHNFVDILQDSDNTWFKACTKEIIANVHTLHVTEV